MKRGQMTGWGIAGFAVVQIVLVGLAVWARSPWLLALGEVIVLPVAGCVALAGRYIALRTRYRLDLERSRRDAERRRIADDVHDLVGHELSLIAMQAGLIELRSSPSQAAIAADLRVRAEAAVRTLHDSLDLINGARTEDQVTTDVTQLVEQFRDAGATATLTGTFGTTTAPTRVTAASVVREALTNAARHAPGKPVTLTLRDQGDDVEILVETTTGTAMQATSGGRGLTAMKRRLDSVGGSLDVSQDAHRHLLVARLPRRMERPSQVKPVVDGAHPARSVLWQAIVPTIVTLGVVLTFYTWASSGATIEPDAQAQLKVGMPASSASDLLPGRQAPVRLAKAPAHPDGWHCRVFTDGNFPLAVATLEVCFTDEVVVRVTDLAQRPLW